MSTGELLTLTLEIQGEEPELFDVMGLRGNEAISRPYSFEIDLASADSELDLRRFLDKRAILTLNKRESERRVHGILRRFEVGGEFMDGRLHYVCILEPAMALLGASVQNQIYGTEEDLSIVDVVTKEVTGQGTKGPARATNAQIPASQLVTDGLTNDYPKRDYIVQYEESDLNFVSRLLEHWGVFYFFRQGESEEAVVLGDRNGAFDPIPRDHLGEAGGEEEDMPSLPFRQRSGLTPMGEESISRWRCVSRPLPRTVILRDYNEEMPHVALYAEAEVDPEGHGVVVRYGDHFRTPEEGKRLAEIRAQELACRGVVFEGDSDCLRLQAGHVFRLTQHPRSDFAQPYVVVSVEHTAEVGDIMSGGTSDRGTPERTYRNTFVAVPLDTPFRPERLAEQPRVDGLMSAHVDAEGVGTRAEIDDQGRYKIHVPFDLSGRPDGRGSRYVRMAQPYAGRNSGMHFPLLKGTEVAVGHLNGDPDRPLISGAVPNPLTQSPSTGDSHDRNRIRTTSGVFLEMADGTGTGEEQSAAEEAGAVARRARAFDQADQTISQATAQRHMAAPDEVSAYAEDNPANGGENLNWALLDVPDGNQRTYLRMGETSSNAPAGQTVGEVSAKTSAGWFDHTTGDHVSSTAGARQVLVGKTDQILVGDTQEVLVKNSQKIESQESSQTIKAKEKQHMESTDSSQTFKAKDKQLIESTSESQKIKASKSQNIESGSSQKLKSGGEQWFDATGQIQKFFCQSQENNIGAKSEMNFGADSNITGGAKFSLFLGVGMTFNVLLDILYGSMFIEFKEIVLGHHTVTIDVNHVDIEGGKIKLGGHKLAVYS